MAAVWGCSGSSGENQQAAQHMHSMRSSRQQRTSNCGRRPKGREGVCVHSSACCHLVALTSRHHSTSDELVRLAGPPLAPTAPAEAAGAGGNPPSNHPPATALHSQPSPARSPGGLRCSFFNRDGTWLKRSAASRRSRPWTACSAACVRTRTGPPSEHTAAEDDASTWFWVNRCVKGGVSVLMWCWCGLLVRETGGQREKRGS